jgi:hypothetical protein
LNIPVIWPMRYVILLLLCHCVVQPVCSQQKNNKFPTAKSSSFLNESRFDIWDIVKFYYKIDPFRISYTKFLNNFRNDPEIIIQTDITPSDSNYRYISGKYLSKGAFFYLSPDSIEETITETITTYTDSLVKMDTLAIYVLRVTGKNSKATRKNFFKEYRKFANRYYRAFAFFKEEKAKNSNTLWGKTTNFYFSSRHYQVPALTVGVGFNKQNQQYIFTIRLVFVVSGNTPIVPAKNLFQIGKRQVRLFSSPNF